MNKNNLQAQVIHLVHSELDRLTKANAPGLYSLLHTNGGKDQVTEMVIRRMIADNLVVQAAIPQLEMEISMI